MSETKRQTEEVFAQVTLYCPECVGSLARIPVSDTGPHTLICPDDSCGIEVRVTIRTKGRGRARKIEADYEWEA